MFPTKIYHDPRITKQETRKAAQLRTSGEPDLGFFVVDIFQYEN